ncbi:methyltransferase [Arcicella sp. LKC2W]|uniref:tRNA1(Val) (adenine(37)-N6)-methyltransferase n=1 Tax=Arcicella sp. LKC2W TaxID=2984198 RepID=UPI002B1F999F|nr:methyltransferase [Arcicella sp. LKC2W]MEA5460211.1 methyltransferase [Arcicella sp. LKC2W]
MTRKPVILYFIKIMPANTHFSFKKFTIHQDQTAMKVTTDACILGAYTSVDKAKKVLDIGTGTGLVAMMLAQRTDAKIDAVEIDINAYNQAFNNIQKSIFKEQINVFNTSIQSFAEHLEHQNQYDLIVSNPPFFQNHLKSETESRNNSLHTDTLSFEDLVEAVLRLLSPNGTFVVLLPAYESSVFEQLSVSKELYPHKKLTIRHREGSKILRIITTFGQANQEFENQELFIKDSNENYTHDFQKLLKEYYLIF